MGVFCLFGSPLLGVVTHYYSAFQFVVSQWKSHTLYLAWCCFPSNHIRRCSMDQCSVPIYWHCGLNWQLVPLATNVVWHKPGDHRSWMDTSLITELVQIIVWNMPDLVNTLFLCCSIVPGTVCVHLTFPIGYLEHVLFYSIVEYWKVLLFTFNCASQKILLCLSLK